MLRIIAGEFGSRRLITLEGRDTRPTLDKVREAVFSSLGTYFEKGSVLDLYAGSGAIGLEALSRGKQRAVLVDYNEAAIKIIKQNIETLKVQEKTAVIKATAKKALSLLQERGETFDLVYLDPPYKKEENELILTLLQEKQLLEEDAVVVVESLKEDSYPKQIKDLVCFKEAIYGISKISYYHFEK